MAKKAFAAHRAAGHGRGRAQRLRAAAARATRTTRSTARSTGDIKVVTWRTDLVEDGTFEKYAEEFNKEYPDVNVTFEGITDYAGEMHTRMSTDELRRRHRHPGDPARPVRAVPRAARRDRRLRGHLPLPPGGELRRHAVRHRVRRQRQRRRLQQEDLRRGRRHRAAHQPRTSGSTRCRRSRTTPTPSRCTPTTRTAGRSRRASATSAPSPTTPTRRSRWRRTRRRGPRAPTSTRSTACCTTSVAAGLTEEDPLTTNWEQSKVDLGTGKIATMTARLVGHLADAGRRRGERRIGGRHRLHGVPGERRRHAATPSSAATTTSP